MLSADASIPDVPLTITWKKPVVVLPDGSLAWQYTLVMPTGKILPEGGEQVMRSWLGCQDQ
jgi:hypothetical protein